MQSIIVIIYNILHNNNKSYEKSKGVYEYLNILKKRIIFIKLKSSSDWFKNNRTTRRKIK